VSDSGVLVSFVKPDSEVTERNISESHKMLYNWRAGKDVKRRKRKTKLDYMFKENLIEKYK
jgi:hypothetical protein